MTTEKSPKKCSIAGCKREYRAKDLCFFHYKKWRQGELPHGRYKTCVQESCKKKVYKSSRCQEHYTAIYGKKEAPAAAVPAAAPAAPAQ